ncbi:MAG: cell division protein ZapA [Oscillospiraceae bacterium]|nr:cell division protein ZapA [Oscillospiraceae bacterium]
MNSVNKVKVTICGKEYNLQTDETPEYLISLAKRVDKEINDLVKAKPNFGIQNAAVFVALTSLDEAQKAADSIENIRTQIKTYMSETAKARKEKEKLADKNKALSEKIEALEKEIKELKKRPPLYDCEQLVLENTITPAVTIYAEENTAVSEETDISEKVMLSEEKQESEKESAPDIKSEDNATSEEAPMEHDNTISSDEKKDAPAESAGCGSDASKGEEMPDTAEHGGVDGGAGTEAQNDGGNSQNADLTPAHQNRKSRKKRH